MHSIDTRLVRESLKQFTFLDRVESRLQFLVKTYLKEIYLHRNPLWSLNSYHSTIDTKLLRAFLLKIFSSAQNSTGQRFSRDRACSSAIHEVGV